MKRGRDEPSTAQANQSAALTSNSEAASFLVAVHCGAGFHAHSNAAQYCQAMREACEAAAGVLRTRGSAVDAVAAAVAVLEDFPPFNAGIGSNLTMDGTVECDASLMDGSTG